MSKLSAFLIAVCVSTATAQVPFDLSALDYEIKSFITNALSLSTTPADDIPHYWMKAWIALRLAHTNNIDNDNRIADYCYRRGILEDQVKWNHYKRHEALQYLITEHKRTDLIEMWSRSDDNNIEIDIISLMKPYADTGDPIAMYFLSKEYEIGGKNNLSLRWMESSAAAGLLRAQWLLFYWYKYGSGYKRQPVDDVEYELYGGKVKYDYNRSLYWLYRAGSQNPWSVRFIQNDVIYRLQILNILLSQKRDGSLSEEDVALLPLSLQVIQHAYIICQYMHMHSDDEKTVASAKTYAELYPGIMNITEYEEARTLAKNFIPGLEINPDYPMSNMQYNRRVMPYDPKQVTYLNHEPTRKLANDVGIDRKQSVPLNEAGDNLRRQQQHYEHMNYQERVLAEQKRSNDLREQQERNRQNIEGMKMITEELHRQYPVYDPLAPGTRNNPYIIDYK